MPSLKMKTKSTTGGLSEKNGLHVCRKSSMITKNPLSPARISQNVEEAGTYIQSSIEASFYDEAFAWGVSGDKTNYDEFFNAEKLFQKQQFNKTGSAAVDNSEPTTSTCTSNVETIFSSILESLDFHNDEGSDNFYVPQLDNEDSDDSGRSSHEYQACSVSDFNISDMIFSAPPIENNLILDNKIDIVSIPDYTCECSNLLCDLTEEYMVLPFLEDNTQRDPDGSTSGETIIDTDNSSLYMGIHQLKPYNQDAEIDTSNDPEYDCFDPQMYFRNLPDRLGMAPIASPNEKHSTKQITLVLDLDETLVHSTLDSCEDADFTFPVFFNMKEHTVYVKKRPHLQVFLNRISEMFEIMVFTASQSIYAKQLLDILDPEGKLLSKRAYRESCTFSEGCYLKDLTVLGVDLAKAAIIDNSPQVFRLQVNNGIPIKSWFDDPSDCGLISLLPFLETLADADDVRPIIARKFGNKE